MTRDSRGMADSLQWAVLTPLLLFTVLGIIQAGVYLQGRSVAQSAAIAAAEEAALVASSPDAGRGLAVSLATRGGLREVTVEVAVAGEDVTAVVSGRPPLIWDVGPGSVTERSVRPRERVTTP